MPAIIVFATTDSALADAWAGQLPIGRTGVRLATESFPGTRAPGFAAVLVLDASAEALIPPSLESCPTIYVGEPRSYPFEQAKLNGRAKIFLSYEESRIRLREIFSLVEELAEKQAMFELIADRSLHSETSRPAPRYSQAAESTEWCEFLEAAVEGLDTRDRLIAEFRRASRSILNASHAVFFLLDGDNFRADRGTSSFSRVDPLVTYFERHPTVVDGSIWESPANPIAEMAVRNYLALWGARLLIPVHDNARLLGLIALGVRNDGRPYDEEDKLRAISFARLLRNFLSRSEEFRKLGVLAERGGLTAKYLPQTLILNPNESIPRHVPLVVRELVGRVRQAREVLRLSPEVGQPFRAAAGLIAESGGLWAYWEEASAEFHDNIIRMHAERRGWFRELALTLSHELSNSLVSLGLLKKAAQGQELPVQMLETVKGDIAQLERLNRHLSMMQTLHEATPTPVDIRQIAEAIGSELGLHVEVGPEPAVLTVSKELITFALKALVMTVGENRPGQGLAELTLQVRTSGQGRERVALISLKGKRLELEGILPEPVDSPVPNLGRTSVFIAKEVLRIHHGEIHAGPGVEGAEILFSFRSLGMESH